MDILKDNEVCAYGNSSLLFESIASLGGANGVLINES